jgi:peptidoglycan hydrolase CwlO-like protein
LRFVALYRVMKNKKYSLDDVETGIHVAEDVVAYEAYLEFLKTGISKAHEERDTVEKQKEEIKNEISSLTAEIEFLRRYRQYLLVDVTSLIRYKVFIKELFYSQPQKSLG